MKRNKVVDKIKRILILFTVVISIIGNCGIFDGLSYKAEADYTIKYKGDITKIQKTQVDEKQIVKFKYNETSKTFSAVKGSTDITDKLKGNLITYSTNICKAADTAVSSNENLATAYGDAGWAGELLYYTRFQTLVEEDDLISDSKVLNMGNDNYGMQYISLDRDTSKFLKEGLLTLLACLSAGGSIPVYEATPTSALEVFKPMSGTIQDSTQYIKNLEDSKISVSFAYWITPLVGKCDDLTQRIELEGLAFKDGDYKNIRVSNTYVTERKRMEKTETSFLCNMDGVKIKGDTLADKWKVMGEDIEIKNKVINRLLDVVYIEKLSKTSEGTYSIYEADSNNTLVAAKEFKLTDEEGKSTDWGVYYDTATNIIYKKKGDTVEELTNIGKDGLSIVSGSDAISICRYAQKDKVTGNKIVKAGILFRDLYEVMTYKYEGTQYTDFTGRKVRFESPINIDINKLSNAGMRYDTDEPVKPKWFITDGEFVCSFDKKYGPTILLKSKNAEESDLGTWIDSEQGQKKLTNMGVDIERLRQGLSDVLSLDIEDRFSWWDRQRFNEIESELVRSREYRVYNFIFILCALMGILIIVYALLRLVAFYIDIVNPFTERSLYNLMTRGKVMPVPCEEDVKNLGGDGDTEYISHRGAWTAFAIACLIGVCLMRSRSLFILIMNTYEWVTSIFS